MIILDLNSEASPVFSITEGYFGKPFIWNMLLDYGGNRGMFGDMALVSSQPIETEQNSAYKMVGTGITPEAIENNPGTTHCATWQTVGLLAHAHTHAASHSPTSHVQPHVRDGLEERAL